MASWLGGLRKAVRGAGSRASGREDARAAAAGPAPPSPDDEGVGAGAAALEAELKGYLAARREHRLFISEYPYRLASRPFGETAAGRKILTLLDQASPHCAAWLKAVHAFSPQFRDIARTAPGDDAQPFWENGMIPALDGMVLYAMVRELKPRTYLEIGSGNSTKFVRKAIRDGGLETRVISIDPHPRAGIDRLCDEVVRRPFEDVPEGLYADRLRDGDMLFIDNSHRSFANSDVTVFFTETLQLIPEGAYYGIHDIYLPFDYPESWTDQFYNEQYLLVSYLLGGGGGDDVVFPGTHVVTAPEYVEAIKAIMRDSGLAYPGANAAAFWMRRGKP